MSPACFLDPLGVSRQERLDVVEMLGDGDGVALALVGLVPLIMVMEDQADHVMEILDEAVARGIVDQPVKTVVEAGKILKPGLDLGEQLVMILLDLIEGSPGGGVRRLAREAACRAYLEQFANLEKL